MSEVAFPDRIRLAHEPMDEVEAKHVTRKIKFHSIRMCQELVQAHDGSAWLALGYGTWDDYCVNELSMTRARGNQLIASARKQSNLALMFEVAVESLQIPERWLRGAKVEELVPYAATAVATLPADANAEQRAAAIHGAVEQYHDEQVKADAGRKTKVTERTSRTVEITEPSPDKHPPSGDAPREQVPAPAAPGATLPAPDARDGEPGRDGDEERPDALRDREPASTPGSADDEAAPPVVPAAEDHAGEAPDVEATQAAESTPPSPIPDPEPEDGHASAGSGSPDRARVSGLFAAALELASFSSDDVAALYVGEDREYLCADALRLQVWAADLADVLEDRTLAVVPG